MFPVQSHIIMIIIIIIITDASWVEFVERPLMREAKERSIFLHVDVPGQEDNAPDLTNE